MKSNKKMSEEERNELKISGYKSIAWGVILSVLGTASGYLLKQYYDKNKTAYTFVTTTDLDSDEYDGIPIYANKDADTPAYIIKDGTAGIVQGKVKDGEKVKIATLSDEYEIQEGYVESQYLQAVKKYKQSELEGYNKFYSVNAGSGVHLRSSTEISAQTVIDTIPNGAYVLGNEVVHASKNNSYTWVKVIYVNEEGELKEGYIAQDYLKEEQIGEIYEYKVFSDELDLKLEPSDDGEKVTTLNKDSLVYFLDNDSESTAYTYGNSEGTADEYDRMWIKVMYYDEETGEMVSGWADVDDLMLSGRVDTSGNVIETEDTTLETESTMQRKVDTSSESNVDLNVREGAGRNYEKIDTIENGSIVTIIEQDENGWVKIQYTDSNGEQQEGWVSGDYLVYVEEISKRVDTSQVGSIDLNVRENAATNYRRIDTIANGSIVTVINEDGNGWAKIKYTDSDGNQQEGWVSEAYLTDVEELYKKLVDTSSAGNADLKLRESPSTRATIIEKIENGSIVYVSESSLEKTVSANGHEWVYIQLADGTKGYVASEYLKDYEEQENTNAVVINETTKTEETTTEQETTEKEEAETTTNSEQADSNAITININSENVLGLDVSGWGEPATLEKILSGELDISSITSSTAGAKNLSQYDDTSIGYVYIRMGASATKSDKDGNIVFIEDEDYVEYANICEKYGIPFGFYYYSTSITAGDEGESAAEADQIDKLLSQIESGNYKYYLLPVVIDVETSEGSRQAGRDVTAVKADLVNLVQSKHGRIILYTNGNSTVTSEKIIDISEFNDLVEGEDCDIWFVNPTKTHQKYLNKLIENELGGDASSIGITQIVLGGEINGGSVDVDLMDADTFEKYISGEYQGVSDERTTIVVSREDQTEVKEQEVNANENILVASNEERVR